MNLIPYICDNWFKTIAKGHDESAILNFLQGTTETLGENQARYNTALMEFAASKNVQTIDFWSFFSKMKRSAEYMCLDGIHPNETGYQLMSKLWIERIPQLKREF